MFIHALTVDRGGCFYYRIRQPLEYLRARGHWTSWGSGIDFETWDRADVLINQLLHYPETAENWVRWCEAGEKLCVWEADDDIFTVHKHPGHGNAYDDPETLPRMIRMIEASHLVTTTTEALARVYRKHNDHVVVLPNTIPDWMVDLPVGRVDGGRFVLGYTGSPSHMYDYESFGRVLERFVPRRAASTVLRYYGADRRPVGLPPHWVTDVRGWTKLTEEYLRSLRMDVGVAPLLDTKFNRGKSGIKALEYGALGIPAVCADMPQYRNVVRPGQTGFLCRTTKSWVNVLESLAQDPHLVATVGDEARRHVAENHLASQAAPRREQAYREAAERIGIHV